MHSEAQILLQLMAPPCSSSGGAMIHWRCTVYPYSDTRRLTIREVKATTRRPTFAQDAPRQTERAPWRRCRNKRRHRAGVYRPDVS